MTKSNTLGGKGLSMSQLLKFKTNGPLLKISIKLANSMFKFLFPAREMYGWVTVLSFFWPRLPFVNWTKLVLRQIDHFNIWQKKQLTWDIPFQFMVCQIQRCKGFNFRNCLRKFARNAGYQEERDLLNLLAALKAFRQLIWPQIPTESLAKKSKISHLDGHASYQVCFVGPDNRACLI